MNTSFDTHETAAGVLRFGEFGREAGQDLARK
jgi:hypothetical protein